MNNKELELQYLEQAREYIASNTPESIDEDKQAVFMAGVQYGLDLREQEINGN